MRVTRGNLALPGDGRTIKGEDATAHYADSAGHLNLRPVLAGGRLVFVFWPGEWEQDGKARFRVALKKNEEVESVTRVTFVKGVETSIAFHVSQGTLRFDVPWRPTEPVEEEIDGGLSPYCYVVVACRKPMSEWP